MATLPLAASAQARVTELAVIRKAYMPVAEAATVLVERPDDADATLALGKFHALVRGDWDRALAMLARGSDLKLKALALADLATPGDAATTLALATGYASQAESENGVAKVNLLSRAVWWYEQAENHLSGLERTRIEKLVAGIDKGLPPMRPIVLHAWTGANDRWVEVLEQVRAFMAMKGHKLTFRSGNPDFGVGDPAPNEHKSVIVVYRYRGGIHMGIAGESTTASIPPAGVLPTPPGKPAPGQELVMLYARYGNEATFLDVTETIQNLVKGGRLEMVLSRSGLPDAYPGRHKALFLVYREAGRVRVHACPEAGNLIMGSSP
jgi:hypothetical protein